MAIKTSSLIIKFSLLLSLCVHAESYTLLVGEIPHYTESDNTGPGYELTNNIIKQLRKKDIIIEILPMDAWKRASADFDKEKVDILFPELIGDVGRSGMTSMPVGYSSHAIFSLNDKPTINKSTDLHGRTVGIQAGLTYPEHIIKDNKIHFVEVHSSAQLTKMLVSKRIDAFVLWHDLGLFAIKDQKITNIHYGDRLSAWFIAYRFHLSGKGKKLMEAFNQAIGEMILSGEYTKIMKNHPTYLYH